jgi:hypothetical protein
MNSHSGSQANTNGFAWAVLIENAIPHSIARIFLITINSLRLILDLKKKPEIAKKNSLHSKRPVAISGSVVPKCLRSTLKHNFSY